MTNYSKLTESGINIDEFIKRLMGNEALVKIFVAKFTEDGNFKALCEAFEAGDMKKAEMASHTLKGMCGNMSHTRLFGLFTEQVCRIRAGESEKAKEMMAELSNEYGLAVSCMREWLSEQ